MIFAVFSFFKTQFRFSWRGKLPLYVRVRGRDGVGGATHTHNTTSQLSVGLSPRPQQHGRGTGRTGELMKDCGAGTDGKGKEHKPEVLVKEKLKPTAGLIWMRMGAGRTRGLRLTGNVTVSYTEQENSHIKKVSRLHYLNACLDCQTMMWSKLGQLWLAGPQTYGTTQRFEPIVCVFFPATKSSLTNIYILKN